MYRCGSPALYYVLLFVYMCKMLFPRQGPITGINSILFYSILFYFILFYSIILTVVDVEFQMLKFAIVCCVVATAFAAPFTAELDDEWQAFKAAHNKQYEYDIEPLR